MTSNRRRARRPVPAVTEPRRTIPRWKQQLESFGGAIVVGTVAIVLLGLLGLLGLAVRAGPISPSNAALRGEAVQLAPASHIVDPGQLVIPQGQPPAWRAPFWYPTATRDV